MLSKIRHKVGRYALQFGETGAVKTDYNEGFYNQHVSNTLDLIRESYTTITYSINFNKGKNIIQSLVFVAIKNKLSSSDFLEFLIGNFSGSIGKNGGVLPLGMGPKFGPKIA